jgi:hypothetical protein
MALTIPFIHHLFHRPGPVVIADLGEGKFRFQCPCGAVWDEAVEPPKQEKED